MRSRGTIIGMVGVLWLLGAVCAQAQVDRGGITGVVTDESGAAISGASVIVTENATGEKTQLTTSAEGRYNATLLRVGGYAVEVQKTGFQTTVQPGVSVGVNQVVRVDVALKLGTVNQTVNVTTAPPLIDTETSSLGTIESQHRVDELPLNGRDFVTLAYLGPGANVGQPGANDRQGTVENPRPSQSLSINGLRVSSNNWLLDGVDNNDFGNGGLVIMPPPDAIQEFRVEENSMSAEFGRGGAAVNVVLKNGSNQFHGGVYGFFRNDLLDARNFFSASKPELRQNQDGFLIGGPIKQNRAFFFGDFQTTHINRGQPYVSTVPTAAERTGDFTDLGLTLYDPLTTNPTTGARSVLNPADPSVIPAGRISSLGQAIVNVYPLPNAPGTVNNFLLNPVRTQNENSFDIRIDHRLSDKDQLFADFAFDKVAVFQPSELGTTDGIVGGSANQHEGDINNQYQHWGLGWTRSLGSAMVNDLHGGYFRPQIVGLSQGYGKDQAEKVFGIPNANRDQNSSAMTQFLPSNYQGIGDTEFDPEIVISNFWQIGDTVSWSHGRHMLKFGADFRRQQQNYLQVEAPQGLFSLTGNYTSNLVTGKGGNAIADLLLGIPKSIYQDALPGIMPSRYWDYAAFVQDDFRVTQDLTLNLGLRHSIQSPENGRIGSFNFSSLKVVNAFGTNAVSHGGVGFDYNDWGPRVGFAWSPFGAKRTVVRSGFGIFYAPDGDDFDDLATNPPSYGLYTVTYNPINVPTVTQFISAGFPATLPHADPNNPSGNVRSGGTVLKPPRIMEWNFNVQHQFGETWTLQTAYVGTRGNGLWDHESGDFNQPPQPLDTNFQNGTQFGRLYYNQLPNLQTIYTIDVPEFDMSYNAFQTSLNKRFSKGLNLLAAYTFANNLGTANGLYGSDVQNVYKIAAEKGPVEPDIHHRLSVSYLYELPFGAGKAFLNQHGVANAVVGGWEITGITTLESGRAINPGLSSDVTNTGSGSPRPDAIHDPYDFSFNTTGQASLGCPGYQTIHCWFNQEAFQLPKLAPGQAVARDFGNAGRGTLRSPAFADTDFSLHKNFALTERQNLQFRVEAFDMLNEPAFNNPGTRVNAKGGAGITSTLLPDSQREIQFALKWTF
jgi:hypothetical protein